MRVVPPLYEFEDCHTCFALGFETAAVEQLAFERGEKALAHRVVEAIADRAHRGSYARLLTALAEGQGGILTALIGVMNHGSGPTLPQGQVERLQHQFRAQMSLHCPAHDFAAESV